LEIGTSLLVGSLFFELLSTIGVDLDLEEEEEEEEEEEDDEEEEEEEEEEHDGWVSEGGRNMGTALMLVPPRVMMLDFLMRLEEEEEFRDKVRDSLLELLVVPPLAPLIVFLIELEEEEEEEDDDKF
jgi:hypothetical protein